MENKEQKQKQELKEALDKDKKQFLLDLQELNGAGQGHIDSIFRKQPVVIEPSESATKELNDAAEATRKAAKIMEDDVIKQKVNELSAAISAKMKLEKLNPRILLGDSPHKDDAAYYVKHANEYVLDKKTGRYVLIELAKQVSAEIVRQSKRDMIPEKDGR